jgi:hypothetical protein
MRLVIMTFRRRSVLRGGIGAQLVAGQWRPVAVGAELIRRASRGRVFSFRRLRLQILGEHRRCERRQRNERDEGRFLPFAFANLLSNPALSGKRIVVIVGQG